MANVYERIGEKIQQLREDAGLSQEELARMLGHTSASSISYFEKGLRKIKVEEVIRIARIFDVHHSTLLPDDGTLIDLNDEALKFRAERQEIKSFNKKQFESDFNNKNGFKRVGKDL